MEGYRQVWQDGRGLCTEQSSAGDFRLHFFDLIVMNVSFATRRIIANPLQHDLPRATVDHLLFDQLVPRIRSHEGHLVAHAAALRHGTGAILLMGASGKGKSTLAAALALLGCDLLGDDAVIISINEQRVMATAIYPSLRLLPDSAQALFGQSYKSSPTAHYTSKLRVAYDLTEGLPSRLPVRGIFVLAGSDPEASEVTINSLNPSRVCMQLIQESFALDPSDTARAAQRLAIASRVAETVPAFELNYPRNYGRLKEVGRAVMDAV